MKNKLGKTNTIIIVFLLFLASLPIVSSDSLLSVNEQIRTFKKEKLEQKTILSETNKINLEKKIVMLFSLINFIKIRFNDNPEIVSSCQKILTELNILGGDWPPLICDILITISSVLFEIWYNLLFELGFPILASLIDFVSNILNEIFISHCDWIYPNGFKLIYNNKILHNVIKSTKMQSCPCLYS